MEAMETSASTPARPPHPTRASPSPSPSPSSMRLWRPAALRNLRNQWSDLLKAKDRWLAAAADGRSHASALVNAHLSRRYMPGMDLGALKDMPGIREKASGKLARREEQCRDMLVSAYREMVLAVADLVKASRSMRCYSKGPANSPLAKFSDSQDDLNDSGDGGGAPVSKWFSILEFESLAQELVAMFIPELQLKRLLVMELLSINCKEALEDRMPLNWTDEIYSGEFSEFQCIGLQPGESSPLPENWHDLSGNQRSEAPSHEILQVYLTTWLANVNIKMNRIDEIFELVAEEIRNR
ncbi:hypothetical protein ACP70R_013698 [Stipagrostis hirtigluma subsp. patula]